MSNEDRQLLGPTSQSILRGDKDWANPSLATLVGVDPPIPAKDRVQGAPDGRPPFDSADLSSRYKDWAAPDLAPEVAGIAVPPNVATLNEGYLDYLYNLLKSQEPDPWQGLVVPDPDGRVERLVAQIAEGYCRESYLAFRDRLPNPLTPEQIRFALSLSKPPWWRFVARRRWRKRYEETMKQSDEETK